MHIQLLSDLHLEVDRGQGPAYDTFQIVPKAEILALLGDIGTICDDRLFGFLTRQLLQFKSVFYVLGNHEFYHMSRVRRTPMVANKFTLDPIRMKQLQRSTHLPQS
jgi:predicted phosphodiesterase